MARTDIPKEPPDKDVKQGADPAPSFDDVLKRMLESPPKPHKKDK